ncbi:hypothetical protein PNEG_03554 [Pneumocystis murina B123]|uniref:B-related factor 1 n=1 Tax=Pneumocystis murina (strain B123) TaxID=1069680 RepID=M7NLU9_PNEMU|nr:hypothetical protein PNEG_03554 [Pneumocystis murina B123]EMR08116.1 hypothetical protein PNEG_03554 [Pneumocystis murina B123]
MSTCSGCGGSNLEADSSSGITYCISCGNVIDENVIVSEITFGEASSGAAIVQGSFVGADQTHARAIGPYRKQNSLESREQTITNGRRRINALAAALHLSERHAETAVRYFTLAVTHNFIQGRRSQYVIASCLYIVCRLERTSHMLIDFSDILQINVFTLGSTFLKLVQILHITLPFADPSLYITRFAALLEFGAETHKVATDAIRLVQRMNRDWMQTGRRPAGICGACLLIAARMNNFRRSVEEIVHIVKVGDLTVRKRLEEFKTTASGDLTVQDFRTIWLEQTHDPPSYLQGRKKERRKKDIETIELLNSHKEYETEALNTVTGNQYSSKKILLPLKLVDSDDLVAELDDNFLKGEMESVLQDRNVQKMSIAIQESKKSSDKCYETLSDMDDDEINQIILSEPEVLAKTQVWMELNREYLAAQEARRLKLESDLKAGIGRQTKKRKKRKPRDSNSINLPSTPVESAKKMLQQRTFSKKINYDALNYLFEE